MRNKRCRSRVRSRGKVVLNDYSRHVAHFAYAQDSERWREWSFRTISLREAKNLVAAGEAEPVSREFEGAVRVVGYRALTPTRWEKPSPATLTFGVMTAVGNAVGRKQDLKQTRGERMHVTKFVMWPFIGDSKAVAVRPRVSAADVARAEHALRNAGARVAGSSPRKDVQRAHFVPASTR